VSREEKVVYKEEPKSKCVNVCVRENRWQDAKAMFLALDHYLRYARNHVEN